MSGQSFEIVFALFPGVTQLDFTGPYQVLCRLPGARVALASRSGQPIETEGMTFAGLGRLTDVTRCDLLLVPGGYGATAAALDGEYLAAVRRLAAGARYVTSVCTGSLVLGAAGLLRGKRAACHWAWRDLLEPFGAIADPGRVVRDGNVITGGGVTAGIDLALTVAAEVAGAEVAQGLQLVLEYAPAPPFDAGRPETAPPEVLARVKRRLEPMIAPRREEVARAAAALRTAAGQG